MAKLRLTHASGFKTAAEAYDALDDDLATNWLSLCELPRVEQYRACNGKRRWKISIIDVTLEPYR